MNQEKSGALQDKGYNGGMCAQKHRYYSWKVEFSCSSQRARGW